MDPFGIDPFDRPPTLATRRGAACGKLEDAQ